MTTTWGSFSDPVPSDCGFLQRPPERNTDAGGATAATSLPCQGSSVSGTGPTWRKWARSVGGISGCLDGLSYSRRHETNIPDRPDGWPVGTLRTPDSPHSRGSSPNCGYADDRERYSVSMSERMSVAYAPQRLRSVANGLLLFPWLERIWSVGAYE